MNGLLKLGARWTALTLLVFVSFGHAQINRNFTARYTIETRGAITTAGNTVLTCSTATGSLNNGTCATSRAGTHATQTTGVNDNFNMVNINALDTAQTNVSQATLTIPTGATVLWAGLYWGGRSALVTRNQVSFRPANAAAYTSVTATQLDSIASTVTGADFYHAFVDVTTAVKSAGSGDYRVANVKTQIGQVGDGGAYGGWALYVAYQDSSLPLRDITIFDGFARVNTANNVSTTVSGFRTPPSGTFTTRVRTLAYEGDRLVTGDNLQVNSATISNTPNPSGNFYNGTVTELGNRVSAPAKNPDYVDQLGIDIDAIDLPTGTVANSATSANLNFTSTGDQYFPGVLTFTTDVFEPILASNFTKTATNLSGSVPPGPGDVIEYTIAVQNTGNDNGNNVVITDIIPSGMTYVPGSLQVVSGANAGTKTDAAGDDQATHNAATGQVTFNVGAGASAAAGGTLAPVASTVIRLQARINTTVSSGSSISNQAGLSFTGAGGTAYTAQSDGNSSTGGAQATTFTVTGRDYGDAPDAGAGTAAGNYQTTGADGGPSHVVVSGLNLGSAAPDLDNSALQNPTATADDLGGTADEDGVSSFPTFAASDGQTVTVPVTVTNATGVGAFLVGYLDFNKNGVFGDLAAEKSATVPVASSTTNPRTFNVSFTVPTGVTAGTTFARFRLGSTEAQVASPVGAASDGEVEDYQVAITAPTDLAVSKTGPASVVRGSSVVYTLKVWNRGAADLSGAAVSDVLSSDLQGAEWACVASGTAQCAAGAATSSGTGNLNLTTGTLPVNAAATAPTTGSFLTVTIRAALNKSSTITSLPNTATVAAPAGYTDTAPANNSSSTTTTVTNQVPDACTAGGGTIIGSNVFSAATAGTFGERVAGDNVYGSPVTDPYGGTFINTSLYAYDQTDGGVNQNRYSITTTSGTVAGAAGFWGGAHKNILDYDNPGTGRFMYVDASATRGYFFRQQVTGLTANTNYLIRFVVMNANVNDNTDPILALQVNGVEYYSSGTIPETATPTWREVSFVFNTGNSTSPLLEIVNDQPTVAGNDLALDSIRLNTCTGYPTGSVSGTVYSDDDRGNDLGAAEPRVAGAQVSLLAGTTVVATTTTDAAGNYSFGNLTLASYSVRLEAPAAGYVIGTTNPLPVTLTTAAPTVTDRHFGLDNEPPTTADRTSPSVPNSSGDILLTPVLSGSDTGSVTGFRITALPAAGSGVLRWDDDGNAATPPVAVALNAVIPLAQAGSLYFDPDPTFVGNATFTYAAIDNGGLQDPTPATYTVPVAGTPDLLLAKADTGDFTVGGTGTYSFTVTNVGTLASSGLITVTDTLPTGLSVNGGIAGTVATSNPSWTCSADGATPQNVSCTSSAAIPNTGTNSSTFNLTVAVGPGTAVGVNAITNTASVSGGGDATPSSASDATTVLAPDLTLGKTATGSFVRGGTGSYTLNVTNVGDAASSGAVTITDTLQTGLSYSSFSGSADWNCSASGQLVTCTYDGTPVIAAAGGSVSVDLMVNVAANAPVSVDNTASVSGGGEVNTGNNSSTVTTPTVDAGELVLTKTVRNVTEDEATPGETPPSTSGTGKPDDVLEYCIGYTNPGQSDVTSVLLTDTVPPNTTALTTPYGGDAVRWTITAPLPAPAPATLSAAVDTDAGELGAVLSVRLGTVSPAGAGEVCFRVTID